MQAQPMLPPCKIGYLSRRGWVAYLTSGPRLGSTLFVKRFAAETSAGQVYPDFGCNAEIYCCDAFIEVESLGPLVTLEPGASTRHIETWELHQVSGDTSTPGGLRAALQDLKLMS
jgi:hypothetical protein